MAYTPRILALAGSLRRDSFNHKLVGLAAEAARKLGAEVTDVDLRELPLPIFDQDYEQAQGMPANARELKRRMANCEGLLIGSPEYNSSITAVLKNAIDWASRKAEPTEQDLVSFAGKTAAIISASPGGLGGLRGLVHLRSILSNIGVLVLPDQRAIARAHEAFDADGRLKNAIDQQAIEGIAARLVETLRKLNG